MKRIEKGWLLRVFIGDSEYWRGKPLYRHIIDCAFQRGLAGATVLRGQAGFGADGRLHTTRLLELATDLPVVIEIVDSAENLKRLLPFLDEAVGDGLVTLRRVDVLKYRRPGGEDRP